MPTRQTPMPRAKTPWLPPIGALVVHRGRQSSRNVRVVAEAVGGRMVVEAIGRRGALVRLTVKRENLGPLQPDLFA